MKQTNKIKWLYLAGALLLCIALASGFFLGSTSVTFSDIHNLLFKETVSSGGRIFAYVRFPRTVASLICGAALSVSGAVIQAVLANRLASPSIIGVNSGAGLAVTLCSAFGIYGGWRLSLFSFSGAFISVMLVSMGAKKWGASRGTVILMGVAMNSLLGAFSDMIITFMPEVGIMSNDFKVGEFSFVTYEKLVPSCVIIGVVILILMTLANELDVLTLGDDNAKGLGMNADIMRTLFLLFAALLAGCAVSIAGLLSFVGLIVPHIIRRIAGARSIHLIGLCALLGSSFVCICDTIARTLFLPYEIPVGMIMAFLGAPFFVYVLIRGKGGHKNA